MISRERAGRKGFTLVEVMISTVILVMTMSMVFMTFHTVVTVTGETKDMLRDIRHGAFAVDQAADALRSASYFNTEVEKYGFWLEDDVVGGVPSDIVSWVTSSPAFMPRGKGLEVGLHRLSLSIEDLEDADDGRALHAAAWQHLLDPEDEDFEEVEPWLVSRRVIGLDCRVYDETDKEWKEEFEPKNKLPRFIRLDFYLKPKEEDADPEVVTRMVHIPVGTFAKNPNKYTDTQGDPDEPIPQPNLQDPSGTGPALNPGGGR